MGRRKETETLKKGKSLLNILQQRQELQPVVCPGAEVIQARLGLCPDGLLQQKPRRNAHLGFLLHPSKEGLELGNSLPPSGYQGRIELFPKSKSPSLTTSLSPSLPLGFSQALGTRTQMYCLIPRHHCGFILKV